MKKDDCKNNLRIRRRKAFTLVELLIVIAIIAILFIVLISKVDFATDKAKATGVQSDFRSFQLAFEAVSRENGGFNTFGWDTGDLNANGKRDSYDEGDTNKDGIQNNGEVWTGHKVYGETFTKIYSLIKPGTTFETDGYDANAIAKLETAINANLDPKLHITIGTDGVITMANGAQDPWNKEYHGWYITNAEVDRKDRGAIVMYSDGANNEFGSEHTIANGIVSISIPGSNKAGKDDYSLVVVYTYVNGYGEIHTSTSGFGNNANVDNSNNNENINTPETDDERHFYMFNMNMEMLNLIGNDPNTYPINFFDDESEEATMAKAWEYWQSVNFGNNIKIQGSDCYEIVGDKVVRWDGLYVNEYNTLIIDERSEIGTIDDFFDYLASPYTTYDQNHEHEVLETVTFEIRNDIIYSTNIIQCTECSYYVEDNEIALYKQLPTNVSVLNYSDYNDYVLAYSTRGFIGGSDGPWFDNLKIYDIALSKDNLTRVYWSTLGVERKDFIHDQLYENRYTWGFDIDVNDLYIDIDAQNCFNGAFGLYSWNGYYLDCPAVTAMTAFFAIPRDIVPAEDLISVENTNLFSNHGTIFTNSDNIIFALDEQFGGYSVREATINGTAFNAEQIDRLYYTIPADIAFKFNSRTNVVKFVLYDGTVVSGNFTFDLEDRVLNNNATFISNYIYFNIKDFENDYKLINTVVIDDYFELNRDANDYYFSFYEEYVQMHISTDIVNSYLENKMEHCIKVELNDGTVLDIVFTLDMYRCDERISHLYLEPGLYTNDMSLLATWNELVNYYGLDLSIYPDTYNTFRAHNYLPGTLAYIIEEYFYDYRDGVIISVGNDVTHIEDYALNDYFNMPRITTVILPSSLESIGVHAINSETIIIYNGTNDDWSNIDLAYGWYYDGYSRTPTVHCLNDDIIQQSNIPMPLEPGIYTSMGCLITWEELVLDYNFNTEDFGVIVKWMSNNIMDVMHGATVYCGYVRDFYYDDPGGFGDAALSMGFINVILPYTLQSIDVNAFSINYNLFEAMIGYCGSVNDFDKIELYMSSDANIDNIEITCGDGIYIINSTYLNGNSGIINPNDFVIEDSGYECEDGIDHLYLKPGLYTANGIPIYSWETLISLGMDITKDYNMLTQPNSPQNIISKNLGSYYKKLILVIPNTVTTIGNYVFYTSNGTSSVISTVILPNSIESIGTNNTATNVLYYGTMEEWTAKTNISSLKEAHCIDGDATAGNGGNECVTADTMILLADGTYKRIDQLTYDDLVMVWNFETGTYDIAPISIIFYHGHQEWNVVKLRFDDGTTLKIINQHGLFSVDDNNYVYLGLNNVDEYIGKRFVKYVDGQVKTVKLVGYSVATEYTGSYCLQTAFNNNYIAEGMFSLTKPDYEGWFDYFEIGNNMKYDEVQMQKDIERYGLYTYEDFAHTGIAYEQFLAFNGPYLKVLVGRGVLTFEDIELLITNYLK